MTQTDASTVAMVMSGQATTGISLGVNMTFTPEQIQQLVAALSEPFGPEVVEWRVTNTSGKRGQVVAYADQRAYTDRLNKLVTPAGWTREYAVQTVQNFEVPRKDGKSTIITAKVMVTAKVTIHGLGSHSGTGEEWAIDENALTRAEAQAFKRACSCFGLGRYFYDLPRTWVDLDENRRPLQLPKLPDWALPQEMRACSGEPKSARSDSDGSKNCGRNGDDGNGAKRNSMASGKTASGRSDRSGTSGRTNGVYGAELRQAVQQLAGEVGFSLTRSVVQAVAGKNEIDAVRDNAKLTSLMEKLTDLARGVGRLRAATEQAGAGIYGQLCQELNLASDSIDDIPNREVLRELVNRMEEAARVANSQASDGTVGATNAGPNGANGTAANAQSAATSTGMNGTRIAQLRNRLLVEARRVSMTRRKGIGDVIAAASNGSFTFAGLTKLTDADIGQVEATLEELARMT
jgi:predicted flap endonuclease-1-like 5' DNA nuclease